MALLFDLLSGGASIGDHAGQQDVPNMCQYWHIPAGIRGARDYAVKGVGAGLVLQVASITPALREASGPLSIRQAARLLNLSNNQVYNWMRHGLPYTRISCGRGNDKVRVDAAELRAWMNEARPTVWMTDTGDGFDCDPAEFQRRQTAVWAMLDRWEL